MAGSSPLSYPTAYAYAYAYTGSNAYAYAAPEAYGFEAGNPLLAGALEETRLELLNAGYPSVLGKARDLGGGRPWSGGLPVCEGVDSFNGCGAQPRMSAAQFELMSRLRFTCDKAAGQATLYASKVGGGEAILLQVKRPDRALFEQQLNEVDARIGDRESRMREITTQVAPPIAYFASVVNLQFGRHRRTVELVDMALQLAYAVGQRFKLALGCPRPTDYTATLLPVIQVPQHASLPAGHAIESLVTAMVLSEVVPGAKGGFAEAYLRRLAFRIADNRIVAGVHFPVDCLVGRLMGDVLSTFVLAACGVGQAQGAQFDPSTATTLLPKADDARFGAVNEKLSTIDVQASALLIEQLARARAEWA